MHAMAKVHTILHRTISQFYVKRAVTQGLDRQKVHPGSLTCIQRFGSAINVHMHLHVMVLEGIDVDRSAEGLTPRCVHVEPPTDADRANVVPQISRQVIRTLRQLGSLEATVEAPVATGTDPLVDDEPEFAHPMAASVQQRIASGSGRATR